jgi:predicted DNA-binding transcriptional regulator YafY
LRADRLLSLMLILYHRKRMTAQALAEHLEVSERTIYRDIDALCTAGIPVYTQSGTGGGVFLDEGYRVSLTGLSRDEILTLFVAGDTGPLADLGLGQAVEGSLLKLLAALPDSQQQTVEQLRQRIYIDPANWFQRVQPMPFMPALQQAVWEDRRVRVDYRPVEGERRTRIIDAYALVAKANVWYLVGREAPREVRTYRLSRFHDAELTGETFERLPDFDLETYWRESTARFENRMERTFPPYPVRLRVHPDAMWIIAGYMEGHYTQIGEPDDAGWYTLRMTFDSPGEARMRVLGLGEHAEVLEPLSLYDAVIATARTIVRNHDARYGEG